MPIIPDAKPSVVSGGGSGTEIHNRLYGLQGGGPDEYFHLTRAEYEGLKKLLESPAPTPPDHYDGGYAGTTDYTQNLDGGPAPDQERNICDGGIAA